MWRKQVHEYRLCAGLADSGEVFMIMLRTRSRIGWSVRRRSTPPFEEVSPHGLGRNGIGWIMAGGIFHLAPLPPWKNAAASLSWRGQRGTDNQERLHQLKTSYFPRG